MLPIGATIQITSQPNRQGDARDINLAQCSELQMALFGENVYQSGRSLCCIQLLNGCVTWALLSKPVVFVRTTCTCRLTLNLVHIYLHISNSLQPLAYGLWTLTVA